MDSEASDTEYSVVAFLFLPSCKMAETVGSMTTQCVSQLIEWLWAGKNPLRFCEEKSTSILI